MTRRAWEASARWAALGVLLGGLGAAVGPAEAVTLIQSCTPPFPIDESGLYVLARDLNCPAGGIIITADNVTLNLNGRTLTGDGGSNDFGVLAAGGGANPTIDGLRVENGTVRGFDIGVLLGRAPGARVAGVTVAGGTGDGIRVQASPGARIVGNTATGGGEDGIDLIGCDGCEVSGNRVAGNAEEGIELQGGSTGARLAGNTATGNRVGIQVSVSSTGNRLEGNTASGNAEFDLEDQNLVFGDPPGCFNAWRGNRFVTDNEGDGPGAGCIQ